MKIFVSAAEISSDLQAEKILLEFIKLYPAGTVEIAGIGGPKLRAMPGFKTIEKAENLRAMGFTEVLGKLVQIKKILDHTVKFLESFKPDLIITFDYPDFHFSLLRACANVPALARTKKICGIPPKVWVWRSKRIEVIRKLYDAVWVLFPFEKKLYEDAGIPVIYAGNPLIAEVTRSAVSEKPEWLTPKSIRLAVMPGSREAEIKEHLKVIPRTLELLAEKSGRKIEAEIPIPAGICIDRISSVLTNSFFVSYRFYTDGSQAVLKSNSLGLIKSGTSTLEAATLGCVPVIFYRVSFITRLIFQFLIRYSGAVGLPNILLGITVRKNAVFPEFLGPEATPAALSDALFSLVNDANLLLQKKQTGESLKSQLVPGDNIAHSVALSIQMIMKTTAIRSVQRDTELSTAAISFLWSSLNAFRRKLYSLGVLKSELISVPSVLVGNLQAGGAGKTPVVISIAKAAVARGLKVGVISRGYGRKNPSQNLVVSEAQNRELWDQAQTLGDEPVEILSHVPEVTLGLGSNRAQIAHALIAQGINFLIFDDGFQNLRFKATKTVLVVSDARPNEVVFRDFYGAALGSDLVLQTKGLPRLAPISAVPLTWEVEALPEGPVWLLCGVGDPNEVAQFYQNLGVRIKRVLALPDHAEIDLELVRRWSEEAKFNNATLVVTEKDWVKIKSDKTLTLFVLRRKITSEDWLDLVFKR